MSVYIREEIQLVGKKNNYGGGLTLTDVTTGSSMVHEFYSDKLDERFGMDEIVRISQSFKPTETVYFYHPIEVSEAAIKSLKLYLELDKQQHYFYVFDPEK